MTENDDDYATADQILDEGQEGIDAYERSVRKNEYKATRKEAFEFEGEIMAEQQKADFTQFEQNIRAEVAKEMGTPTTLQQQDQFNAVVFKQMASAYEKSSKTGSPTSQGSPQGQPQGQPRQEQPGPKPSEVHAEKREKLKKSFLTEDDEMDIIDTLFNPPG